jgi:hypothetical protein
MMWYIYIYIYIYINRDWVDNPVAAVQHAFTHKQYTEYREWNIHNNKNIKHKQQ